MFSVMAFYLTLAIFIAEIGDTVLGKVLMRTATTNGINLRAYIADVVVPGRTDALVLELSTAQRDGNSMALWHTREKSFFWLELHDSEGKPVKRTSEGERRLVDIPRKTLDWNSQRMAPVVSARNGFPERFNLSELYILEEGKTYTLRVQAQVKRLGEPYEDLNLQNLPIKVREILP